MSPPGPGEDDWNRTDLDHRVRRGVMAVASRGGLIAMLGLAGQLVLTRLLVPADFGAAAFGLSTVAFINLFADGGLGAGLIRRREPPRRAELQALSALQVGVATAFCCIVVAMAPLFGRAGWVTAVIVCSAPVLCLQIPARITLERGLLFERIARAEVLQVLVFHLWAVGVVIAGGGVWGLATAPLVRSVVGVVLLTRASPTGTPFPRFSWSEARSLLRFGVQFQSVTALWLLREQGLNIGIAAVGGIGTLGLISLGRRVLEIPNLLIQALYRVSFPAMSQLVAREEQVGDILVKIVRVCASGTGLLLVGLAAAAPGVIPGAFGDNWSETAQIVPPACLGLLIGGSISVACQGYLFARDDSAAVIRAGVLQTASAFAFCLLLLPWIGLWAVGLGLLASSTTEAVVLARAARRHTGARLLSPVMRPAATAVVSGTAGWWLTWSLGDTLAAGLVGGGTAMMTMLALMAVVDRLAFHETIDAVRHTLGSIRGGAPTSSHPVPGESP